MRTDQMLCIPGPTPIPARVVRAADRPMINPRGADFAALLHDCLAGLQAVLQTQHELLLFGASGTGGLEAAVANLLSPGERALFCTNGWFSELWSDMAATFGANVVRLKASWGEAIDPERVRTALAADAAITKVFVTHNETSTGVLNDIAAIASVVKTADRLLIVDSVSGVPCHPLPIDELGIDVTVTASQKGWLAPPGLTMIAVSDGAMRAASEARCPSWYFDFQRQRACQDRGFMHTTPPVSVLYALQEGLTMIREDGMPQLWRRHERLGRMTRRGVESAGLEVIAHSERLSNTVTAVHSPFETSEQLRAFLSDLLLREGLVLAHGLGKLEGRSFRIGHLGPITEREIDQMLASITSGLMRCRPAARAPALAA